MNSSRPLFKKGELKIIVRATGYDLDELEQSAKLFPEFAKEILRDILGSDHVIVSEGAFSRYPTLTKLWEEIRHE